MASFPQAFELVENGSAVTTPAGKILFKVEVRPTSYEEVSEDLLPLEVVTLLQSRGEDISFSNLYFTLDSENVVSPYGFPLEDIESDQWLLTV